MNAYELADELKKCIDDGSTDLVCVCGAVNMLRQQADRIAQLEKEKIRAYDNGYEDGQKALQNQADRIEKLEQALQSIANEPVELSHDKIKWQCQDHIRWAKEALK